MKIFNIVHEAARQNAIKAIQSLDLNDKMRVEIKKPKRSLDQNSKMWAMLNDISKQLEWHGHYLSSEDWKNVFTASLKKQRSVPNLEGDGFVVLGTSTKDMSKEEFADLITLIEAFGAEQEINFQGDHNYE